MATFRSQAASLRLHIHFDTYRELIIFMWRKPHLKTEQTEELMFQSTKRANQRRTKGRQYIVQRFRRPPDARSAYTQQWPTFLRL